MLLNTCSLIIYILFTNISSKIQLKSMLFFTEFWTFEIHHLSSHYPCHTKHDRSTAISTSFSTCWKYWLLKSYLTSIINIFLYQMNTKNSYAFKWSSTHVPVVTFIMHLLKKSPLTSIRNSKIQSFLTFHVIACVNWFVDPTIQAAETYVLFLGKM